MSTPRKKKSASKKTTRKPAGASLSTPNPPLSTGSGASAPSTAPEAPASVRYPGRTPAYIQRRVRFAEAFCATGDAVAAFLDVTPKAQTWKAESVRREAHTLLHDEITQDTIAEINALNRAAIIPKMNEIVETLSGIMRGTLMIDVVTDKGKKITVPPDFKARLGAAKQLTPLVQTRETLAAQRENAAKEKPFENPEAAIAKFMKAAGGAKPPPPVEG